MEATAPIGDGKGLETYFMDLLTEAGLKKIDLGRKLGIHPDTVSRWGESPPRYAITYLELYVRIKRVL